MGQTMPKRLDLRSVNAIKETTRFNKDQIRDLYKAFREISGGVWEIDREHFEKAFQNGNVTADMKFVDRLYEIFDMDKEGKINLREFCTAFSLFIAGTWEETMEAVFLMYDLEGIGKITPETMVEVLTVFSRTLEMKEFSGDQCDNVLDTEDHIKQYVQQVFADVDTKKEGKLGLEEFVAAVTQHPLLQESATAFITEISKDMFSSPKSIERLHQQYAEPPPRDI